MADTPQTDAGERSATEFRQSEPGYCDLIDAAQPQAAWLVRALNCSARFPPGHQQAVYALRRAFHALGEAGLRAWKVSVGMSAPARQLVQVNWRRIFDLA